MGRRWQRPQWRSDSSSRRRAGCSPQRVYLLRLGSGGTAGASPARPSVLAASPTRLNLGAPPLGTYNGPVTVTLTNRGTSTDTIGESGVTFSGTGWNDYLVESSVGPSCPGSATTIVLAPSASCTLDVYFYPGALGDRSATLSIKGSTDTSPTTVRLIGSGEIGYYQVDRYGHVAHAGDAPYFGDLGSISLNRPSLPSLRPATMAATGWSLLTAVSLLSAMPPSMDRPAASC